MRFVPSILLYLTATLVAQQPAPANLTVLPFVLAGASTAAHSTCPAGTTATISGVTTEQQAQLLASIQQELTTRLAQHAPPPSGQPLALSGCITRMEAGSKAKRVIGLTMGASYLSAIVTVLQPTSSAPDTPLRSFTVEIKGDNPAPPVFGGAIYNAIHNKQVSLDADAIKLADRIADRFLEQSSTPTTPAT